MRDFDGALMARRLQSLRRLIFNHVPPVLTDLLGRFNKIIYRGTDYRCPICLSNLKSFLPLPREFRITLEIGGQTFTASDFETLNVENYLCPVCRCSDRDRLFALFLKRISENFQTNRKLIHFAPERALSSFLKRNFKYSYKTADLHRKDVDDRVDISKMDHYESDSVDCFICSHILEHVQAETMALKELYRILKPSGWGILIVPVLPDLAETYEDPSKKTEEERLRHFGQKDHQRVYGKNHYLIKLRSAGFHVSPLGADFFGEDLLKRHGISVRSCLYVVHKTTELMIA